MTRSRETTLARVWQNPPTSKRYVPGLLSATRDDGACLWTVFDQVEQRFVPDDDLGTIDPDARFVLR